MRNSSLNDQAIVSIAKALGELNDKVVYVGGAVVGLYVNDPAAEDVRPTKDVDITLEVFTLAELEILRQELTRRGFRQSAEDNIICRFRYNGIALDVMSTTAVGWAPANPWFAPGFLRSETFLIAGTSIRILSLPYYIATKLSAYRERGNNDPRTSHDLEDVIYLLDNGTDVAASIERSDKVIRAFLAGEFSQLLGDPRFNEAILGNIPRGTQTERFTMILGTLRRISRL